MISTLASGSLIGKPKDRISQGNQRTFVTAQLRAASDNDSFIVSVICFEKELCQLLLALDKGDEISVAGPSKPTAWTGRNGDPAVGLSIIAHQVLTAYRLREKRKAVSSRANGANDYLPAQSPLPEQDSLEMEGGLF